MRGTADRQTELRLSAITKAYGATTALDNVSLSIRRGTVHGLVGENGAGKSTLGKVVGGIVHPDSGRLEVRGQTASFASPRDAIEAGVAVMSQEITLVPAMSVIENVFLGVENRIAGGSAAGQADLFRSLTDQVGFHPPAGARVDSLSISEQQRVQILRALARGASILIMDEPTSSQHREELRKLHAVLGDLRDHGMTIIYVSHFLDDVVSLADEISILRSGMLIETIDAARATPEGLLRSMLGESLEAVFPTRKRGVRADAAPVLEVSSLSRRSGLEDISLEVRRGEIVGIAGLVGSGRTELARSIFGADGYASGTVRVNGVELRRGSIPAAIKAGLAFVPEDRISQGLLHNISQEANILLPHLREISAAGIVRQRAGKTKARRYAGETGVTPMRLESRPSILSGGNQQKVLFAKWLCGDPKVLILDEPTRGVDVGAKSAIYHLVAELADERGLAVLIISSEIEEIVELSDRVLVLHEGKVVANLVADELESEQIMRAAFGYSHGKKEESDVDGLMAAE